MPPSRPVWQTGGRRGGGPRGAHKPEPWGERGLSAELQADTNCRVEGEWGSVSSPPHRRALRVLDEICSGGFGPADTSLSGGGGVSTPRGAHRLIERLKFTFAPSRLNSHFSSSHNTPLSRRGEEGLPTRRCMQSMCDGSILHISTGYHSLHK